MLFCQLIYRVLWAGNYLIESYVDVVLSAYIPCTVGRQLPNRELCLCCSVSLYTVYCGQAIT